MFIYILIAVLFALLVVIVLLLSRELKISKRMKRDALVRYKMFKRNNN